MNSYKLPDDSAGVSGEIGVLAERDYFFPQNRKSMGDSLMLALDELQKQQADIKELAEALRELYLHATVNGHRIADVDDFLNLANKHLKGE